MAMGTAKILGIDLIDNFNAPYFSQSIAEFWRRWHISLSTWFRDYLYIPLGGNRKGALRKDFNVLVTFAVSGLWHGAQWNYMAWGLLNGLYQIIGAALLPLRKAVVRALHIDPQSRLHKLLRVVVTFALFNSTLVLFRAYRLMDAVRILISMATVHNFEIFTDGSLFACGIDAFNFALLGVYALVMLAVDVCKYKQIKVRSVIEKQHWLCQVAVVVLGVLAGLCRAPGGLLLGLAALELAAAWRRGKRPALASIPAMLAPAAGLGLYFGLNQAVYGRWNQYSVYQWEHWGQKLGLFTDTVRYHLDYMASWWEDNRKAAVGICLAAILCILLALGLLAASVRRLPAAWLGFGLAYLAVTMGATWLLSAPRYAVGLFCLPVALALLLQDRPRLTCGVLAVQVMVSVVYTWQYLHGWPIY